MLLSPAPPTTRPALRVPAGRARWASNARWAAPARPAPRPRPLFGRRAAASEDAAQALQPLPGRCLVAQLRTLAVLERLAAAGRLTEGQLAVARAVLPQLEFGQRGTVGGAGLAAALLQLAVRAGGCNITQRAAAAAVRAVGAAVSEEAVRQWRERCQEAWERLPDEQRQGLRRQLPAPAVLPILLSAAKQGLLSPAQHPTAAALVSNLGVLRGTNPPLLATALLVVLNLAVGRELPTRQAAAAVQLAGYPVHEKSAEFITWKCLAYWKESAAWQAILGPPVARSAPREREMAGIVGRLEAAGQLSERQAATLRQLLPGVRHFHAGAKAGLLAGALLVLQARAEGRELSGAAAAAAVRSVGTAATRGLEHHLLALTQLWQANRDWQRLLGAPVSTSFEGRFRATLVAAVQRLADQGAMPAADLPLALQLCQLQLPVHRKNKPGVVAAGLLVVLSLVRGHRIPAPAALAAVWAAGLDGGIAGVRHETMLLHQQWQESAAWQALLGPAPPDMQALRRQAAVQQPAPDLRCAMEQLAAQGALTPAELPLALELADSLPPLKIRARKPGALAAAVLVLAAQARGRRITLAIAATAVTHVGLECSVAAVFHRLRNLQQHWTESAEWQKLLGPPE